MTKLIAIALAAALLAACNVAPSKPSPSDPCQQLMLDCAGGGGGND